MNQGRRGEHPSRKRKQRLEDQQAKRHAMTRALTSTMMMLTVTVVSAYMLPSPPLSCSAPAHMQPVSCGYPARRAPFVQSFAEDEPAMAPVSTAQSRVQPLTTVLELDRAVADAQQSGRLLVVKVFAPWCAACRIIAPRYQRAASSNLEVDFYDVNFSQAKPLCKHSGVESLPTGMVFKDGVKVEHSSLRPSDFKGFMGKLAAHVGPGVSGAAVPVTGSPTRLSSLSSSELPRMVGDSLLGP